MSERLCDIFDECRKQPDARDIDRLRQNYFIQALMEEDDSPTIAGLVINRTSRENFGYSGSGRRNKGKAQSELLIVLDALNRRLDELEASMRKHMEALRQKYGDRVVDGMVETFLLDDEKSGLDSEDAKLQALADKFLNPDGSIKDEYRSLEEAQYVRDWNEAQKLRPVVAKYEGRHDLTPTEYNELVKVAQSVGLADRENLYLRSDDSNTREILEGTAASRSQDVAQHDDGFSAFKFGK